MLRGGMVMACIVLAGCAAPAPVPVEPAALPVPLGLACPLAPCPVDVMSGVEPWVAVDPADPQRAVVAAMGFHAGPPSHPWLTFATTTDGGRTWATGEPVGGLADPTGPLGTYDFAADVMLAWGRDGPVLAALVGRAVPPFTCLAGAACTGSPAFANVLDLAVWRSTDGGATFADGRIVAQADGPVAFVFPPAGAPVPGFRADLGSLDREHLAADRATGALHLVWAKLGSDGGRGVQLWSASSPDGGATWTAPALFADGAYGPAIAAHDGIVLAAYRSFADGQAYVVRRSTDGGATWGEPVKLADANGYGTVPVALWTDGRALRAAVAYAQGEEHERIVLQTSEDGGATWGPAQDALPVVPTPRPVPGLAVDPLSGRGALVAYRAAADGTYETWAVGIDRGALGDPFAIANGTDPRTAFDYLGVDAVGDHVMAAFAFGADARIGAAPLRWA